MLNSFKAGVVTLLLLSIVANVSAQTNKLKGTEIRNAIQEFTQKELPYACWVFVFPEAAGGLDTYVPQIRTAMKQLMMQNRQHEKIVFVVNNRYPIIKQQRSLWIKKILGDYYPVFKNKIEDVIWDNTGVLSGKLLDDMEFGLVFGYLLYGNKLLFSNEIKWHKLNYPITLNKQPFTIELIDSVVLPCNVDSSLCTYGAPSLVDGHNVLYYQGCYKQLNVNTAKIKQEICFDERKALELYCNFFAPNKAFCSEAIRYYSVMKNRGRASLVPGHFEQQKNTVWNASYVHVFLPYSLLGKQGEKTTTDVQGYSTKRVEYFPFTTDIVFQMDTSFQITRAIPVTVGEHIKHPVWKGEPFLDLTTAFIINDSMLITYWSQSYWFYRKLSPRRIIGKFSKISPFCGFSLKKDTFDYGVPIGGKLRPELSEKLSTLYGEAKFIKFNGHILFSPGVGSEIYDVYQGDVIAFLKGPGYIDRFKKSKYGWQSYSKKGQVKINFIVNNLSSDGKYLYVEYLFAKKHREKNVEVRNFIEVFDSSFTSIAIIPLVAFDSIKGAIQKFSPYIDGALHDNKIYLPEYNEKIDRYVLKIWEIKKREFGKYQKSNDNLKKN